MSLVLSNAFKGLLLSSYVNIKVDLAVKSIQDLIDKPKVEIYHDNIFSIKGNMKELTQLRNRIPEKDTEYIHVFNGNEINKFRRGQAVIFCVSFNCKYFQLNNNHLNLVYTEQHYYHGFRCLYVIKSHSHSKKINKL